MEKVLKDAVDMHVHASPDVIPRRLDAVELARRAQAAGMKAVVLKSHVYCTAPVARVVASITGLTVMGGIVLNHAVGGVKAAVVEAALALGAKIVWMPTISALNHLERVRKGPTAHHLERMGGRQQGITILSPSGDLLPEVREILKMAKGHGAVLATGHLSPQEAEALALEAQRLGFGKLVVTHPEFYITALSIEEQRRLSRYGVYFERCYFATTASGGGLDIAQIAEQIKAIGPESTVLSSDLGQVGNPDPVEGFAYFIAKLKEQGLRDEELRLMVHENPLRLLEAEDR